MAWECMRRPGCAAQPWLAGWARTQQQPCGIVPGSLSLCPLRAAREKEVEGDYSGLLASSTFCLVLPGDGWTARMEDAMLHGCIPVIIMASAVCSWLTAASCHYCGANVWGCPWLGWQAEAG